MIYLILGIVALAVIIPVVSIIGIEYYQLKRNQKLLQSPIQDESTGNLVIYFSRSGNTELMANQIARSKHAQTFTIAADRYKIGFWGWIHALQDARNTIAEIEPEAMDLTPYDTIYLGSPIWLYSPAPPIWEFARNNNFQGKKIVLFNSMNSKFEQHYIDEFASLIKEQGGEVINHIYVIRGRMTQQMEVDAFLEEVKKEITKIN